MPNPIRTQTLIAAVKRLGKSAPVSSYLVAQSVVRGAGAEVRSRVRAMLDEAVKKGLLVKSSSKYSPVHAIKGSTSLRSHKRRKQSSHRGRGRRQRTTKRGRRKSTRGKKKTTPKGKHPLKYFERPYKKPSIRDKPPKNKIKQKSRDSYTRNQAKSEENVYEKHQKKDYDIVTLLPPNFAD